MKSYTDSISDANNAIKINPKLSHAYLRKGMAAFALEEFESARTSFEKGQELDPGNIQFKTWIRKCIAEMEEGKPKETQKENKEILTSNINNTTTNTTNTNTNVSQPSEKKTVSDFKPETKIRHEWFQTETTVTISVFSKNIKKENFSMIDMEIESVSLVIKLDNGNECQLHFDLCDKILPDESSFEILSTKIEIKLKKLVPNRWLTLEKNQSGEGIGTTSWGAVVMDKNRLTTPISKPLTNLPTTINNNNIINTSSTTTTTTSSSNTTDPTTNSVKFYPSSKGKKNWDKITKETYEEEKIEGEEALNKVFQDIYSGASDDQKRAMMKSFSESGGTVLSTNWDEVGKKKVTGSSPNGMEMHEWNEKDKK